MSYGESNNSAAKQDQITYYGMAGLPACLVHLATIWQYQRQQYEQLEVLGNKSHLYYVSNMARGRGRERNRRAIGLNV